MSHKGLDPQERQKNAIAARLAMLEKHRAALNAPELAQRLAERKAVHEARLARMAEREEARKQREAELAREAALAAERAREAEREAQRLEELRQAEEAEKQLALLAEQKAARDARYAARKAAKKMRRRGY